MTNVDPTTYRILSLLRDRPLSSSELVPLLDAEPDAAKETVRRLLNDGLVSRLAGALKPRVLAVGAERGSEPEDDEPLTLTFRGILNLS
jgi:hypothetical protein